MEYQDFDLLIDRSRRGYRAQVLNSPAGQAAVEFRLPFSPLQLENFLLRLGRAQRTVRRVDSSEMHAAKTFGSSLFKAVFAGEVSACFRSSQEEAKRQGVGLRVRLRLADPELADLPWEYLYNPSVNRFIALSVHTPLVRYMDLPERIQPIPVTPPIRALVMISSPTDYPRLDAEGEWKKLTESVSDLLASGMLTIDRLDDATLSALQRRLRRSEYHIFHFIGHGEFDQDAQEGVLILEGENERGHRVSSQYLGMLLHDHGSMRVTILNACEGARTSRSDPFAGSAQSLVQQGIPAVIAMQFEIADDVANTFAHEFYGALADGYPIDAALTESRKAIFASGHEVEWGTPVLYLRAPEGRIFDIDKSARPDDQHKRRIAALRAECEAARARRDWTLAVERLQALLELDSSDSDARAWLADAEAKLESRARDVNALVDEAERNLAAGHVEAALAAAEEAAGLDESAERVVDVLRRSRVALQAIRAREVVRRGREQFTRGDLAAAAESVERALSLSAHLPEAVELQQAIAEERRRIADKEALDRRVRSILDRAESLLRAGAADAALDAADRALELDAQSADAAAIRARALALQEQEQRRIAAAAQAADLRTAARLAIDEARYADAFARLDEARALDPGNPDLPALEASAKKRQADEIERQRREAAIAASLAHASECLDRDDLTGADQSVRAALEMDAGHPAALALQLRVQSAVDEHAAREREIAEARDRERKIGEAIAAEQARIQGYLSAGELSEAEQALERAAATFAAREPFADLRATLVRLRHDESARNAVAAARATFAAGDAPRALAMLASFAPAHPAVSKAHEELTAADAADRARREAERRDAEARAREAAKQQRIAQLRTTALAAIEASQPSDASAALDELGQLAPDAEDLAALRDRVQALAVRLVKLAQAWREAESAADRQQYSEALESLSRVLEIEPAEPRALALRAQFEQRLEERRAREAWVQERLQRARAARHECRFEDALAILSEVRDGAPDTPGLADLITQTERDIAEAAAARRRQETIDRHLRAASANLEQQKLDAAMVELKAVLQLDRAHEGALRLRARVDEELAGERQRREEQRRGEERARQAAVLVEQARNADTDDAALDALRRAQQLDPAHAEIAGLIAAREQKIAERRRRDEHDRRARVTVDAAGRLFRAGKHDNAIAALASFSPPHALVSEALSRLRADAEAIARRAREATEAREAQLARARKAIEQHRYADALAILRAIESAGSTDAEIAPLRAAAEEGQRRVEAEERQRRTIEESLQKAAGHVEREEFDEASTAVQAVLALEPQHERARALGTAIAGGTERLRRARHIVAEAVRAFESGNHDSALAALRQFTPPHRLVEAALFDLRARAARAERRRRAAGVGYALLALPARLARDRRVAILVLVLGALGAAWYGWVTWQGASTSAPQGASVEKTDAPAAHAPAAQPPAAVAPAADTPTTPEQPNAGVVTEAERREPERVPSEAARPVTPPPVTPPPHRPKPAPVEKSDTTNVPPPSIYLRLDDLIANGTPDAALTEATRILGERPGDARATAVITQFLKDAERAAVAARTKAGEAGADVSWSDSFAGGLDREKRARRAGLPQDRAVREWWDARRFYDGAAAQGAAATRAATHASSLVSARPRDALAAVENGLRTYPRFRPFDELLRQLHADAQAQATKAEADARAARRTGTQAFKNAAAEQEQAEQSGVTVRGVQALYRAIDAYKTALTAAVPETLDRATIQREVEEVLAAVARAYETKDMDAINRLLEFMRYESLKQIERDFKEYRTVTWNLALTRLDVLSDGVVRATCMLRREIDKKSGRDISDVRVTAFTLRKAGGEWKILSQDFP